MLGDDSIVLLVVLVCMVVMSAYFSATETAFTSLNRIRLKSRADNGDARAARVLALAEKYDLLLSTILIGNNIVNNVATTLSAVLFIDLLGKTTGFDFRRGLPQELGKRIPGALRALLRPHPPGVYGHPHPRHLLLYPVEEAVV